MRRLVFAVFAGLIGVILISAQGAEESVSPVEIAIPRYPLSAFTSNTSGEVEVEVLIDGSGSVTSAKALSGPYSLRPASEKAAAKWRFPGSRNGKSRTTRLIFDYRRQSQDDPARRLYGIYKPPNRVEVIGEEESTVILADPAVEIGKPKKSKDK